MRGVFFFSLIFRENKKDKKNFVKRKTTMENRKAFVMDVMKTKKVQTRKELCTAVGYDGISTIPLQDWEREATRRFELKFEQYLARWHQEDLAQLPSLHLVFPYL